MKIRNPAESFGGAFTRVRGKTGWWQSQVASGPRAVVPGRAVAVRTPPGWRNPESFPWIACRLNGFSALLDRFCELLIRLGMLDAPPAQKRDQFFPTLP